MPVEEGGFTVRGDSWFIRESLIIESGLATALDDHRGELAEAMLRLDAEGVRAQADRVASVEGAEAARRLLIREARRLTRWERAINLGLAGNDAEDPVRQAEAVRSHLAKIALSAVVYGFHAGVPAEHLMNEVVAAGTLELGGDWRYHAVQALAVCYRAAGRPDLALSMLARSPGSDPARDMRTLLDTARTTYAVGRTGRIAELLRLTDWPGDPTGLARDLIRRLVTEHEPSPAELAARVGLRGRAMDTGDWAGLRELATSDVMWLAEDATLWRALSAILRMNGAADQAILAGQVSDLVAAAGDSR